MHINYFRDTQKNIHGIERTQIHLINDDWQQIDISEAKQANNGSLDELKVASKESIVYFTSYLYRSDIQGEMYNLQSDWSSKALRAERVLSGRNTSTDIAIIQAEATKRNRNETVKELAEKQLQKANNYAMKVALIDGMQSDAKHQIEAVTDISELEPLLEKLKASMKQEIADLAIQRTEPYAEAAPNLITKTTQKLRSLFRTE